VHPPSGQVRLVLIAGTAISRPVQTNLDPPFFALYSPQRAGLTQFDSGFNIQFLRCPEASSIPVITLFLPGINAEAFRAGLAKP